MLFTSIIPDFLAVSWAVKFHSMGRIKIICSTLRHYHKLLDIAAHGVKYNILTLLICFFRCSDRWGCIGEKETIINFVINRY